MTRAQSIAANTTRDDDTALIAGLRRDLAATTDDRDNLLLYLARITTALGLPEGTEIDKVVRRIEELV
jgi:hypothetical protein